MPIPSPNPEKCSAARLLEYLEGSMAEADQLALEIHLNNCVACQQMIEAIAADKDFWNTATHALENSDENSSCDLHLRGWLDPTDAPNALGSMGQYLVHQVVGRGGMGVVLSAFDQELGRSVAIKTLANPITTLADEKRRLLREARASANVRHPHIVPIHSVESWRDVPIIVMPLIEGGTLEAYATNRIFSAEEVLGIASQIASALIALHRANIVHRDIKPSNILLSDGIKHCLLSDFGLARQHGDANVTHSDVLLGTPHFMSPEQALGKDIDFRSDLFSLGSVLYWLATGNRPFVGRSNYEILHSLVQDSPDYALLTQRGFPAPFRTILEGLLAKEPDARWSSAEEFLSMVEAARNHRPFPESANLPKANNAIGKRTNTNRNILVFAVVAISAVLATIIFFPSVRQAQKNEPVAVKESIDSNPSRVSIEEPLASEVPLASNAPKLEPKELTVMLQDLSEGKQQKYWLLRLESVAIDQVPVKAIDELLKLEDHLDPILREMAKSILNKNPFQETIPSSDTSTTASLLPDDDSINPFEEVVRSKNNDSSDR